MTVEFFGRDLFEEPVTSKSKLRARFVVPPFSVLNAASGEWKERKRRWLDLGIRSEIGRNTKGIERFKTLENCMTGGAGFSEDGPPVWVDNSVFDPVLCECVYNWWCPRGGQIVDPFAGGSVRGIVATVLGFDYWGCELRSEQVAANVLQGELITPDRPPIWVCGDSRDEMQNSPKADFIFSCPPYGDLEVYSADPRDISNMPFPEFAAAYKDIISKSCDRLKENRFACFVVSNYRAENFGLLRNFVGGTVQAFQAAGLGFYNELTFATSVGTGMLRATRQFNGSRKIVKTHQTVLVFVKGDWRQAVAEYKSAWGDE